MAVMNEQQRRFLTSVSNVQLLHAIGRKARMRERVVCSAATYVHRGLPDSVDVLLRLTTALWVASKVEETPVSVATLLDAVSKLGFGSRCRRRIELELSLGHTHSSGPRPAQPHTHPATQRTNAGWPRRFEAADMVATECAILEAFQFNLCSPSGAIFHAVAQITHTLGPACPEPCAKTAFAVANDCFRFDLVLRHPPAVLAAACVHAAAAAHQLPGRQWLEQLDPASLPAVEKAAAALCGALARCAGVDLAAFDACPDIPRRAGKRPNQPPPSVVGGKRKLAVQ